MICPACSSQCVGATRYCYCCGHLLTEEDGAPGAGGSVEEARWDEARRARRRTLGAKVARRVFWAGSGLGVLLYVHYGVGNGWLEMLWILVLGFLGITSPWRMRLSRTEYYRLPHSGGGAKDHRCVRCGGGTYFKLEDPASSTEDVYCSRCELHLYVE